MKFSEESDKEVGKPARQVRDVSVRQITRVREKT